MNVPKLRFKEFKNDWSPKNLSEVVAFSKGNSLSKSDLDEQGSYPCILYGELYTKYHEVIRKVFSKTNYISDNIVKSKYGDILIPASGETPIDISTSSCILLDNVLLGGDINILSPKNCDGRFISYMISNNKRKTIARVAQGHSIVHLYSENLKKVNLDIPLLSEQKKIADMLELLDKKIELQTKKIEALKLFKKGLLKCEYNKIKNKNLSQLDNIAQIYQPQTLSQKQLKKGVYPVFGANGIIGFNSNFNHKLPQITISCRGENSGSINKTPEYCWINGNSMVINVDNNPNINKDYLKLILESQNLKYLISGSGQPQIVRFDIAKHKIPIISIDEQLIYIKKFNLLDSKLLLEISELKKLNLLKKGLMQNMFI